MVERNLNLDLDIFATYLCVYKSNAGENKM